MKVPKRVNKTVRDSKKSAMKKVADPARGLTSTFIAKTHFVLIKTKMSIDSNKRGKRHRKEKEIV